MGLDEERDSYRRIAAELINEGKALLTRDRTRSSEVEDWQKPALKVLNYLGAEGYESREARHGSFLEWAGTVVSERARKHNLRLTLDALEAEVIREVPVREESAAPPRRIRPAEPEHSFDEALWTRLADEAERMRLVDETARALGVALPKNIMWSGTGSYSPDTDTMALPDTMGAYSADEYKSIVAHELQHKVQNERGTTSLAYVNARGSLKVLAEELIRPDHSLPLHLRATTMLAGASAYATFVLLGKTVGYQSELDADAASARAVPKEAAISSLEKGYAGAASARNTPRADTWLERVMGPRAARVVQALEDDHPSLQARVDALRRQEEHGRMSGQPRER